MMRIMMRMIYRVTGSRVRCQMESEICRFTVNNDPIVVIIIIIFIIVIIIITINTILKMLASPHLYHHLHHPD